MQCDVCDTWITKQVKLVVNLHIKKYVYRGFQHAAAVVIGSQINYKTTMEEFLTVLH